MKASIFALLLVGAAALVKVDTDGPKKTMQMMKTGAAIGAALAAAKEVKDVDAQFATQGAGHTPGDEEEDKLRQLPNKNHNSADVVKRMMNNIGGKKDAAESAYPANRNLDTVRGLVDQSFVNPVSSIVAKHDKKQIAALKEKGKIAEGFPDLTYVHIPKTGGDAFAMAATPLFPYGFNLRSNLALNLMIDVQKQGPNHCFFEQIPPQKVESLYSKKVSEEAYEKRQVFCAVRNPHDRMVSEWENCLEFGQPGKCGTSCDAEDLNLYVNTELSAFAKGDYLRNTCFLIPQMDYLEGPGACTHVLDFNHLERDFNVLMGEYGYNLTLPKADETHRTYKRKCHGKITKADLTPATKKLIEMVYERDFKELGPKYGWTDQTLVEKAKNFIMAPIKALTTAFTQKSNSFIEQVPLFENLPEPSEGHRD